MAGAACNADAIWPDELVVIVIARVFVETFAVPFFARLVGEFWIWKKPKAKDAGRFAVNAFVNTCRFRFDLLVQP